MRSATNACARPGLLQWKNLQGDTTMAKKPAAEVHLEFAEEGVRLTMLVRGNVVEKELFRGEIAKVQAVEVARVLFDDAFDLTNYVFHGIEHQRR